uniref:IP15357p n=1 Tax=Drosophila melanogaster TaxID=7227 RepID=Q1RKZ1_DROME|nr:IP15357p [Drosophila melanogaster]
MFPKLNAPFGPLRLRPAKLLDIFVSGSIPGPNICALRFPENGCCGGGGTMPPGRSIPRWPRRIVGGGGGTNPGCCCCWARALLAIIATFAVICMMTSTISGCMQLLMHVCRQLIMVVTVSGKSCACLGGS